MPDGLEVHYQWEEEPLGTAGALHLIERPEEPFLVMNGDILTTLDYGEFLRAHSDSGAALTIATHRKDVPLALGVIESEGDTVTGYVEKPTLNYHVSMGIYGYSPWALDHVPEGRFDFPDLVLKLLAEGERVGLAPLRRRVVRHRDARRARARRLCFRRGPRSLRGRVAPARR